MISKILEDGTTGTTEDVFNGDEVEIRTKATKEEATADDEIINGKVKKKTIMEGVDVETNGTTGVVIGCSKVRMDAKVTNKDRPREMRIHYIYKSTLDL